MLEQTGLQEEDLFSKPQWVLRVPLSVNRQEVQWREMANENLKFTLDLLYLHHSPFVGEALSEVIRRIDRGCWLDIETPPPPRESLPKWLKVFPFSLLWSQRPRKVGE
jgi:hypothetical protein